ncbi:MAG: TRAP-type C4-dicarboxylate transport system permease small subunit [Paracoccaceae bacterium]|jgi:TRAP-type C4-dicarboxylate transport system permease small subunit
MSNASKNSIPKPLHFGIVTVPRFIIGCMILVGILINVANVIGRYMFLEPIIWAEEIMIYIMVWTVFIGAILVSYDGQHLKMDVFSVMLPSPYKEIINFIATASVLLVCIYVIPNNWIVVELMWNNDQRSVVAEVPMVIPHFAILAGFTLIFIGILVRFRSHVSGTLTSELDLIVKGHGDEDTTVTDAKN